MIVTDDQGMANRMRNFRSQGIDLDFRARAGNVSWFYEVVDLGYNYRLPDINAALGLNQLKKLNAWLARRRSIAKRYIEAFKEFPEIIPPGSPVDRESAWHLYLLRLDLERLKVGKEAVFKALSAEGLGVNVHYIPVPWHPFYRKLGYKRGQWPVGEGAYEQIISIPLFPAMTDEDVEDVIEVINKVISAYRI